MPPISLRQRAIALAKLLLPARLRAAIVRQQRLHRLQWPRAGTVNFGALRRVSPISPIFGIDRGLPVDRYYIEQFLRKHAVDITGRCLELGDAYYIDKFGGGKPSRIDVLHYTAGSPDATIIADLTSADHIPSDTFDCIIFTQSLQMIYDFTAALRTLHRILKPGGVVLLTTHGISKIGRRLGRDDWGEYWHFTAQSIERVLVETFPNALIEVGTRGNVLTAVSYLHGLATEELTDHELNHLDPDYEVIVTARVQKAPQSGIVRT
ncbi:MAG: methyltransferase domain-containing protein [Gemmatimonadota bacterium]